MWFLPERFSVLLSFCKDKAFLRYLQIFPPKINVFVVVGEQAAPQPLDDEGGAYALVALRKIRINLEKTNLWTTFFPLDATTVSRFHRYVTKYPPVSQQLRAKNTKFLGINQNPS